jgi:hypothetical protein
MLLQGRDDALTAHPKVIVEALVVSSSFVIVARQQQYSAIHISSSNEAGLSLQLHCAIPCSLCASCCPSGLQTGFIPIENTCKFK